MAKFCRNCTKSVEKVLCVPNMQYRCVYSEVIYHHSNVEELCESIHYLLLWAHNIQCENDNITSASSFSKCVWGGNELIMLKPGFSSN